jgi:hypothetical protein
MDWASLSILHPPGCKEWNCELIRSPTTLTSVRTRRMGFTLQAVNCIIPNVKLQSLHLCSGQPRPNSPTSILIKARRRIKNLHAPITRRIPHQIVMPKVPRGIAPSADRMRCSILPTEWGLRTKCRILIELFSPITRINLQDKVVVPDVASRCVDGFEGVAGAVAEAGDDCPACLLFGCRGAGGADDFNSDG